jgi:hypothetical protein
MSGSAGSSMVSANMTANRVELRIASTAQADVFFFDFEESNSTVIWASVETLF